MDFDPVKFYREFSDASTTPSKDNTWLARCLTAMCEKYAKEIEKPANFQDAPLVRRNTFEVPSPWDPKKTIEVVYASFAACIERKKNSYTVHEDTDAASCAAACMDCRKPYSSFPLDMTIPDEQWLTIHGHGGGILCANCMVARLSKMPGAIAVRAHLEITNAAPQVPDTVRSGELPMTSSPADAAIKKEELVHGTYYFGRCRNASIARWDAKVEVFKYWRGKFGVWFLEEIKCPEDDSIFDVFVAERVATEEDLEKNLHSAIED